MYVWVDLDKRVNYSGQMGYGEIKLQRVIIEYLEEKFLESRTMCKISLLYYSCFQVREE